MADIGQVIDSLRHGVIVSCQALEHEPMYGSHHMAAMAVAAKQGGAVGIRANTPADIAAIKQSCSLPIMGIYKQEYPDSDVFITPTLHEAKQVADAGASLIAVDATLRRRPGGQTLQQLMQAIKMLDPGIGIVADVSTFEEGVNAMELGADLVSTTLSGYTPDSVYREEPDFQLIRQLAALGGTPVVAEGRIWTIEDCRQCMEAGAYAVVIGTAITRPREITGRFVRAIQRER
ncbi:N-acetylmannosamine-6-phosphate 2-epimerase [Paenibacillus hemerocallicola]|uniref:Putative N-acetylmannosamine-6-phosphate 2-epimerase n=1 Tax=Paenibacillus hemerocallicola TaxID=1172614 RepID=A0A5C4TFI6_9BACL|nr:N-acetylmannosamine-6-phosphate 2-epimerase [Paenibacillus hemerocallicola]TNJ67914.1 N-acetylmannosamine-6-phosphate 2-epimerase [Paenibacillus hemerocallicola]